MRLSRPPKKLFSLREANAMLPLVQPITEDIVRLTKQVKQTFERLELMKQGGVVQHAHGEYRNETLAVKRKMTDKSEKVLSYVSELVRLNLLVDRVPQGHVDFPAQRNGETVCLCWRLGEPEVRYWHGANEACSERRPVDLNLIRNSGDAQVSKSGS